MRRIRSRLQFRPRRHHTLIETALDQIRASVAADLLERVRQVTPARFESLVLDLLHALGYGESRSDLQRVGGSGDGGIDGVISLDKLGLQKVYVQAKRWASGVGSPEIQTFMGVLQLQGADRGVIITSGEFSKAARDAAGRAKGTIVLVDGKMLTRLMVEHEVGVTHKALRVPKVDADFFED
jgi:restriction system protein